MGSVVYDDLWIADSKSPGEWSRVAHEVTPWAGRLGHTIEILNNQLFVFGGQLKSNLRLTNSAIKVNLDLNSRSK